MFVSDLTEHELIARVRSALPQPPPWLLVGIGDDAAVVEPERNRVDLFTVDAIVEGVHFERRFTPPAAIGHRALAVNLSDLAAMGATPRLALLSMALPPQLPCADFDELVGGLVRLARAHKVHLVGGNLTRTAGPLVVDVTAAGTAKRRGVLVRSGARAGDEIYVTGTIGSAAAGLHLLRSGTPPIASGDLARDSAAGDVAASSEADAVRRYLYPEPRVRTGVLLGRNRAATACMDLSDGLADAVAQVAGASGVGAIIDATALPIHPAARACFGDRGEDELMAVASGSDDYELLVTVRPRLRGRLLAASGGAPFTRIGVCTPERDVRVRWTAGAAARETPLPVGFSHFR